MATIQFKVRSRVVGKLAPVYLRFVEGSDFDVTIKTSFKVTPDAFKNGNIDKNCCNDVFTVTDAHNLNNDMGDLRQTIMKAYKPGMKITRDWLVRVVYKFHTPNEPEPVVQEVKKETLTIFIKRYIDEMQSGKRLTIKKKQRYSDGTIRGFKSWLKNFEQLQTDLNKQIDFDDVHIDLYNEIIQYLYAKKFRANYVGKIIKNLKTVMEAAKEQNLHKNIEYTREAFATIRHEVDTVALTAKEVEDIRNLKIEDEQQALNRDVFLVGIYTSQRFSDYHRINEANIRTLENGKMAIAIRQRKTDNKVLIPARYELIEILSRYNNNLPKTHEQYVNSDIKTICRMAGITQKIEIVESIGGYTVRKTVDKCTMVTTHTARRTGATLMFLSGMNTISLMKITGHKSERQLYLYLRMDANDNAELISKSAFFNPPVKLKVV